MKTQRQTCKWHPDYDGRIAPWRRKARERTCCTECWGLWLYNNAKNTAKKPLSYWINVVERIQESAINEDVI